MLTRKWMYNRNLPGRKGLTDEFITGVDEFIQFAINQDDSYKNGENIRCPCFKCRNTRFFHPDDVVLHLYRRGFKQCYWNWTCHGEELFPVNEEANKVHDHAPSVWEGLQKHWESEEFKKISEKNKKNRAESGSSSTVIYHGGPVSTAVPRLKLTEELNKEPTLKECFIRTHGKNDDTLESGRATQIVEQFDKALVDKCNQGVNKSSIYQNEPWDEIAVESRNRVLGKSNIIKQMPLANYKSCSGPSQSIKQLHDRVKELKVELASIRTERDVMQAEWARRDSFEASLLAALQLNGIDLSNMHVATFVPPVPRALMGESQSHADEHSSTSKRLRISPAIDNPLEDPDDVEDLC